MEQTLKDQASAPAQEVLGLLDQALAPALAGQIFARLSTLLGALQIGILFVDADQRVVIANVLFSRIWSLNGLLTAQRMQVVADGPDGPGGRIWLHEDITQSRRNEQRARLALIDQLTGLPNRRGL